MERDEVRGTANDVKGRVKRQAGEWAGDEEMQVSGAAEQAKGKIQKVAESGWKSKESRQTL